MHWLEKPHNWVYCKTDTPLSLCGEQFRRGGIALQECKNHTVSRNTSGRFWSTCSCSWLLPLLDARSTLFMLSESADVQVDSSLQLRSAFFRTYLCAVLRLGGRLLFDVRITADPIRVADDHIDVGEGR